MGTCWTKVPNFVQLFLLKHNDLKIGSTAEFLSMSNLSKNLCNMRKIFYFLSLQNLYNFFCKLKFSTSPVGFLAATLTATASAALAVTFYKF